MIRQYELVDRVKSYLPNVDEKAINRAYVYALKVHGSQTRASGDPYFSHPVEVAGILTGYKLDETSIITALLHDTLEDTEATYADIEEKFGAEVAKLVDGVTKLARIELVDPKLIDKKKETTEKSVDKPKKSDPESKKEEKENKQKDAKAKQAENFRKLVLAMSEDIRVLLVKLADRLHNMRTLHHVKNPEKRQRIALETMEIYAPLAERIGMQEIKSELEDLAFAQIDPEARNSIVTRLQFLREEGKKTPSSIALGLKDTLENKGLIAHVHGREKSPYSIWRKMTRQNLSFEQLSDIIAFRVMVDDQDSCYRALGIIHSAFSAVPDRFRDYLSTPKRNGYSSLHTTVIGPLGFRIEIQIRTHEMHEIAENGVAAHWQYKQDSGHTEGRRYHWLRELLEILEHAVEPEEFLENTKLAMFQDQVFCFSPKGDIINLPAGATPVDFAYAVHSEVGDGCVGAKINGRKVPLHTVLANGDQVEIIRSKAQHPQVEWDRFVVSAKARAAIRRFTRLRQQEEWATLGRMILERAFTRDNHAFSEKGLVAILPRFGFQSVADLCASVGSGDLEAIDVVKAVFPGSQVTLKKRLAGMVPLRRLRSGKSRHDKEGDKRNAVSIKGLERGMALHFGKCCHPIPGDRIVGIVASGLGVKVHTIDCDRLEEHEGERDDWLDLSWGDERSAIHVGRLDVIVINEPGSMGEVCSVIGKFHGNILNLKITERAADFFTLQIDIDVQDVKHLVGIIAALRAAPSTNSVQRARG